MQRHSVTSLETALSLANGPSWGGGGAVEGEVCILRSPGIATTLISLLSMGGVCGRSLTAAKILFIGRQTCSLYLRCVHTRSDNACAQACDKLPFRKMNGNCRKCSHRMRATNACARCFQATSDKILNFYNFTRAL